MWLAALIALGCTYRPFCHAVSRPGVVEKALFVGKALSIHHAKEADGLLEGRCSFPRAILVSFVNR